MLNLRMKTQLATGLGSVYVTRDGKTVWEITDPAPKDPPTVNDIERMVRFDQEHCWQIVFNEALSLRIYERQGPGLWILVLEGEGFA